MQKNGQEDGLKHTVSTNIPIFNSAHKDKPEIVEETHFKLEPLGDVINHVKEEGNKVEQKKLKKIGRMESCLTVSLTSR